MGQRFDWQKFTVLLGKVRLFEDMFNVDTLGGGFKYVLSSPLFGEDSQFDKYFSNGLKPPTSCFLLLQGEFIAN